MKCCEYDSRVSPFFTNNFVIGVVLVLVTLANQGILYKEKIYQVLTLCGNSFKKHTHNHQSSIVNIHETSQTCYDQNC